MIRQTAFALLATAGITAAHAASGVYLGPSVGIMDADANGFDDATNAGVLLGYEFFSKQQFYLSVEGELTTTVSDGDVKIAGQKGDWDIDTRAAFLAARVGDTFYIKVRYGAAWSDVSVKVAGFSASDSDSSVSWGGALGWNITPEWALQADGTRIDSDVNYWSLGVLYRF
ncbi:MAG TPA: porin family protein [Gammaproteobacteria bacterium]|nr:porin family protein [Gammaproteobacteria bacterium]